MLLIQRIVFPHGYALPSSASQIMPLYVQTRTGADRSAAATGDLPDVLGRTTVKLRRGQTLNVDAYFNRLYAGYWFRWTTIRDVQIRVSGTGHARVVVRRSTAGGVETTVRVLEGELDHGLVTSVPLAQFAAGGCIWLEVEAIDDTVTIDDAGYWSDAQPATDPRTDIAICTYNRPDDVFNLLTSLEQDEEASSVVNHIWVVDNGEESFEDLPGGPELVKSFGDRLSHLSQPNLGGSGGFSRGMFEAAYHSDAPHVLLLDDDVLIEPEGLRRAVVFAALAKQPVVVGGPMLNRADPIVLHTSGEWVDTVKMVWTPAPGGVQSMDLRGHRQDAILDVGFNAWWSCLIPTAAVREVGLGMPFFIKYDDVEYAYRLARAGYRTVTLPGAAVWHEPWTLKDDAIDWTNYFHVRNRLVFTAMMSAGLPAKVQQRRIAAVTTNILIRDVLRNVLRRAFTTAAGADLAMRDFLRGPDGLHEPLQDTVSRVRADRLAYPDAATSVPTGGLPGAPTTVLQHPPKSMAGVPRSLLKELGLPAPRLIPGAASSVLAKARALASPTRSSGSAPVSPARSGASADPWRIWEMPQAADQIPELPKQADDWWGLTDHPDAWVTTIDGSRTTRRTRQPDLARSLMKQAWATAQTVKKQFARLADEYAAAGPELSSPQTWAKQFGIEVDR